VTSYQQFPDAERQRREKRRAVMLAVGVMAVTVGLGTPGHPGLLLDGPFIPTRFAAAVCFSVLAGSVCYAIRKDRPDDEH
jgi:hypothetical protein